MNLSGLVWEEKIFPCIELKKDQIISYNEAIDNDNSCSLKLLVARMVSLINEFLQTLLKLIFI